LTWKGSQVRSLSRPPPTVRFLSISGITRAPIVRKSFFVNSKELAAAVPLDQGDNAIGG
jgi:hypothetical protein